MGICAAACLDPLIIKIPRRDTSWSEEMALRAGHLVQRLTMEEVISKLAPPESFFMRFLHE